MLSKGMLKDLEIFDLPDLAQLLVAVRLQQKSTDSEKHKLFLQEMDDYIIKRFENHLEEIKCK